MVQSLDNKVAKHIARQDDLLLRAIIRIWRARARGQRLEQFQTTAALRRAWQRWQAKLTSNNAKLGKQKLPPLIGVPLTDVTRSRSELPTTSGYSHSSGNIG